MSTKHFVNDPQKLVADALRSLAIVQPILHIDLDNRVVHANPGPNQHVAVISGGGSGHEPSFTGLVGSGGLTAAVAGTIFASPSSKQIYAAMEMVGQGKDLLVVVMNYTGDVLNFGLAMERFKAQHPGIDAKILIVGDDVGVPRSRAGKVGRRGIAGTVLVQKIAGAMAARGYRLAEVERVAKMAADNMVTLGVSLGHVHVPGRATTTEDESNMLAADEIELGLGIHNEPGCERLSGVDAELPALVRKMLKQMLDGNDPERSFLQSRLPQMVLLVNNLGGTSVLELGAIVTEVVQQLRDDYNISPARVVTGTFMTSLNGPGFSISLMNVLDTGLDTSMLSLLDDPCEASGWTAKRFSPADQAVNGTLKSLANGSHAVKASSSLTWNADAVIASLRKALHALIAAEPEVTRFDDVVGDGDCGTTLKRGALAILQLLDSRQHEDFSVLIKGIVDTVEDNMDGTSGALYAIFLNALSRHFQELDVATLDAVDWAAGLKSAMQSLSRYTAARVGDRTMMDTLIPFVDVLETTKNLEQAIDAARQGAESTRTMVPKLGRSVYVGAGGGWMGKIPDPGAWGLAAFLTGLLR